MKARIRTKRTGRVRDFLQIAQTATSAEIAEFFGFTTLETSRAIDSIVKGGDARRLGKAAYEWTGGRADHTLCPKQFRVWRTLVVSTRMGKPATAGYIYEICGGEVSRPLVWKTLCHLKSIGAVTEIPGNFSAKRSGVSAYVVSPDWISVDSPPILRVKTDKTLLEDKIFGIKKAIGSLYRAAFSETPDLEAMRETALSVAGIIEETLAFADGLRQKAGKPAEKEGCDARCRQA